MLATTAHWFATRLMLRLVLAAGVSLPALGAFCAGDTPTAAKSPSAPAACTAVTNRSNTCITLSQSSVSCVAAPLVFPSPFTPSMKCSANVPMNITTAITSGRISVGLLVAFDQITTSIIIIPNTTPGALTAQIPQSAAIAPYCRNGVQNLTLYVYDGDPPANSIARGRILWNTGVTASVSCSGPF